MARTKGAKNKTAGQIAKEAAAKLEKQTKKLSPEQKKEAQEAIKELADIQGGDDGKEEAGLGAGASVDPETSRSMGGNTPDANDDLPGEQSGGPGQNDDTAGQDGASGDSEPGAPTTDGSSVNGDANTSDGSEIRESGDTQKPLEGVPQGVEDSGPADRGETAPGNQAEARTIPGEIKPVEPGVTPEDGPDWAPPCTDQSGASPSNDSGNRKPTGRNVSISSSGKKFLGRHPITKEDVWR